MSIICVFIILYYMMIWSFSYLMLFGFYFYLHTEASSHKLLCFCCPWHYPCSYTWLGVIGNWMFLFYKTFLILLRCLTWFRWRIFNCLYGIKSLDRLDFMIELKICGMLYIYIWLLFYSCSLCLAMHNDILMHLHFYSSIYKIIDNFWMSFNVNFFFRHLDIL